MELNDRLESHERVQEKHFKEKITEQCRLGQIVVGDIGKFLNNVKDVIHPWDLFPQLFEKERVIYEKQILEVQLEEYKEKKRAYVAEANRRRHMGEEV